MTLTRSFKETVIARIDRDAEFRDALLREGIECLLEDHVPADHLNEHISRLERERK
jgi:hypothetical protein